MKQTFQESIDSKDIILIQKVIKIFLIYTIYYIIFYIKGSRNKPIKQGYIENEQRVINVK